uniref:Kinesin-associated microtubule-binding domain-containing protein n=1 Tax=Timema cristinae TaxID=61476 RepID=A0A7R9D7R1_TIMCR|nr:unnamed protein product [Timema cristinae]
MSIYLWLERDLNSALTQQIAMLTQLMSNIKAKSDDVAQMAKQAEEEDSGTGQTIEMLSNAIITDLDKSVLNEPDVVERFSQERMEVFTGIEEAVERSSTYMSEAGRYLNDLKNEMVSTLTSGESAWRKHYTHTEQDLRSHLERLGSGLQDELELTAQLADVVSVCANNNEAALERRRHTLTTFVRERQDDIVAECSYVSDWTRRTVAEVQQRAQELDRFLTEDLRKDLPTGQTPKRKEFHYPHQLVATSPHDRILERFRARSEAMMGDTQPMLDLSLETLPGFEQCNELDARELFESDGNDPGYQYLNDDEILHQVIEDNDNGSNVRESDDNEEMDVEEAAGPSHSDTYETFQTAMNWLERQPEGTAIQLMLLKRLRDMAAKKRTSRLVQKTIKDFFTQ